MAALACEEFVRNLDEEARAVAGLRVAAAGAAVGEVDEDLDAFEDDVVRPVSLDGGDETDTACIVFIPRVVQALGSG